MLCDYFCLSATAALHEYNLPEFYGQQHVCIHLQASQGSFSAFFVHHPHEAQLYPLVRG